MSQAADRRDAPAAGVPAPQQPPKCERSGCRDWGTHGFTLTGRSPRHFCGQHSADGERYMREGK